MFYHGQRNEFCRTANSKLNGKVEVEEGIKSKIEIWYGIGEMEIKQLKMIQLRSELQIGEFVPLLFALHTTSFLLWPVPTRECNLHIRSFCATYSQTSPSKWHFLGQYYTVPHSNKVARWTPPLDTLMNLQSFFLHSVLVPSRIQHLITCLLSSVFLQDGGDYPAWGGTSVELGLAETPYSATTVPSHYFFSHFPISDRPLLVLRCLVMARLVGKLLVKQRMLHKFRAPQQGATIRGCIWPGRSGGAG